jgi:hypothetical protein
MTKQKLFEATKIEYLWELERSVGKKRASEYTVKYIDGWVTVRDGHLDRLVAKVRLEGFIAMWENVCHNPDFETSADRFKNSNNILVTVPSVNGAPFILSGVPETILGQWGIEYRGKGYRIREKDGELYLEKVTS